MRIAVIGAGLSGLNAARILSEYCRVDVYEKGTVGGLAGSLCNENYCIEAFYHHFFRGDEYLISLLKELGLKKKIVWRVVKVGQEHRGRIYSLSTPLEIILYPGMSISDKLRLASFTINAKRRNYREFDEVSVIDGLMRDVGDGVFQRFFMPLLRSKFGENYRDVSYAWLLARVSLRANRKLGGEELGYLKGGFHQLVSALSENLNIMNETAEISKSSGWIVSGQRYDAIVYTGPIPELKELAEHLGIKTVRYQSSICLLMGMKERFHESLYWVNYESEPFGATIEHTNFMDFQDYGEHLMYVAAYTTPDRVFEMRDDEIFRAWVRRLSRYGLDERKINWWRVFRARYSGPIYERGYMKRITPYRVRSDFYIAGMTSEANYPERSMNGSLLAGREAANAVIEDHLS